MDKLELSIKAEQEKKIKESGVKITGADPSDILPASSYDLS
jgi:hypothetical protein